MMATVDVKQAVSKAIDYISNLYSSEHIAGLMLEEVELSEDGQYWLVTLGFNRQPEGVAAIGKLLNNPYPERAYKVFKIRADNGEVVSMKIRTP